MPIVASIAVLCALGGFVAGGFALFGAKRRRQIRIDARTAPTLTRAMVRETVREFGESHPQLIVRVGLAGKNAEAGREHIQDAYVSALKSARIVVTSNPDGWEGDYRTSEALSSGALVLCNYMLNPLPGLNQQAQCYKNYDDLMRLLDKYTRDPDAAQALADAQKTYTVFDMFADIERHAGLLGEQVWHFLEPAPQHRGGEYANFALAGADISGRRRTSDPREATVIVLHTWRLMGGKIKPQLIVQAAQAARAANPTATLIALDWMDLSAVDDAAVNSVDVYFKRSQVDRRAGTRCQYPEKVKPLYYPVKPAFADHMRSTPPHAHRNIDVACFLK